MKIRAASVDASPEQLVLAASAAEAFLDAVGVTPEQAARGYWEREGWDMQGFVEQAEPSAELMFWAETWEDAHDAAEEATGLEVELSVPGLHTPDSKA
jgi:hypothetical protein